MILLFDIDWPLEVNVISEKDKNWPDFACNNCIFDDHGEVNMIIVDKALEKRHQENNPIRVAMIGAGFMGRGVALQILNLCREWNWWRSPTVTWKAHKEPMRKPALKKFGLLRPSAQLEDAIAQKHYAITEDAMILCRAEGIDAVIEVTGVVEFGAQVALEAIENSKHVVTMNAELDGTVGPILKVYADKAGVVFTAPMEISPGLL